MPTLTLSKTLPGLVTTKTLIHRYVVTSIAKKSVDSLRMQQQSVRPTLLNIQMIRGRKMIDWDQEKLLITFNVLPLSQLVIFQLHLVPTGHLPRLLLPFIFHPNQQ